MNNMSTETFWNFSVQHYDRPGVAEACLKLQDGYDLDVNLVLFCLWYGRQHGVLSNAQFEQIFSFTRSWSGNVVKPLRQARRWIKQNREATGVDRDDLENFREKIKQLELDAEKLQQNQMQRLAEAAASSEDQAQNGSADSALINLDAYLALSDIKKDDVLGLLLATLTNGL